ncbi:MAG: protein kinase [candidate division Zixibacteria bacterium]|nr:protein kinase [candidate division Zixibacteria bacterium]
MIRSRREDDALMAQFRLLRALAESGFVTPLDFMADDGHAIGYTTEFVEAESFLDFVTRASSHAIVSLLEDLALAFAWLHSLDHLHCDIKSDNVLVRRYGERVIPCVLDLGFAVRQGTSLPTEIRGSPGHTAPEMLDGGMLTAATDIYSFGRMVLSVASCGDNASVAADLSAVADRCAADKPQQRYQSFWEVRDELRRISRRRPAAPRDSNLMRAPLWFAGLDRRVSMLSRRLEVIPAPPVTLLTGIAGAGKSTVLREHCLRRQAAGLATLRVCNVECIASLIDELKRIAPRLRSDRRGARDQYVFVYVETIGEAKIPIETLSGLARLAQSEKWRIILEHRETPPDVIPDGIAVSEILPLTIPEVIRATSHLAGNPALASANGRAVFIATGGSPQLIQYAMTAYTATRGTQRSEPFNFDALPASIADYWKEQFDALPVDGQQLLSQASVFHGAFSISWLPAFCDDTQRAQPLLSLCVDRGWFARTPGTGGTPLYRFTARSARNTIRLIVGEKQLKRWAVAVQDTRRLKELIPAPGPPDIWELKRLTGAPPGWSLPDASGWQAETPEDHKLVLYARLCELGTGRTTGITWNAGQFREMCEAFGRLGSTRRQKLWANRALKRLASSNGGGICSGAAARDVGRLFDFSGDPSAKERWLRQSLPKTAASEFGMRGYLLSELGALLLDRRCHEEAHQCILEAEHSLSRSESEGRDITVNLVRSGIACALNKRFAAAERYLERSRRLAKRLHADDMYWRSVVNLGWLASARGDPETALRHLRGAARYYRETHCLDEYLVVLSNMSTCLLNLGRGFRALQTVRLVVSLSEMTHNRIQYGHATNNLGNIFALQGAMAPARRNLTDAIITWRLIGDPHGVCLSELNIARACAIARMHEPAKQRAIEAMTRYESLCDQEGVWDCLRLLAKSAIDEGLYGEASEALGTIPQAHPDMPDRDRLEADLLRLSLALWTGHADEAETQMESLLNEPLILKSNPLRCDLAIAMGHLCTLHGRFDEAMDHLSTAARESRQAVRVDKLLDTLPVMALLAKRMRNFNAGLRYLATAQGMIESMQAELP